MKKLSFIAWLTMKAICTCAFCITPLVSCNTKNANTFADSGRTQPTENLLANLKALGDSVGYMFGHHDDVLYGIGWVGDSARSDVKSVCGDYPALLSFDLGHLELGDTVSLDGVSFNRIREEIVRHFERGGMITLSWHLNNPLTGGTAWINDSTGEHQLNTVEAVLEGGKQHERFLTWLDRVAEFLNSLQTADGVRVPVLFRPWHEHTGSWFWWGQELCSAEQYKALWKLTTDRLKEQGVVNALYAYSPGTENGGNPQKYMERYPGDNIIDLLGLDCYCFAPSGDADAVAKYAQMLDTQLGMVCKLAKQHSKAVALTETGYEGIKTAKWWTHTLMPVLDKHPISYVLVWRNAHDKPGHFFAPYPGHSSAPDFVEFYNHPKSLFLHNVNGLYQAK